ncbi:MAG: D-isomer specific 2-hydroxyacid dehydrogenase [Lentinula lateritia]|uniref:D-isomer specific 2-hydroxyacid dehydrogenase n=1 Tax=Lentinula lateritia TaxID=40482 RepID=A0ABQ8VT31_9AGAR|nr:MAG: D-isomer specific 2-hydroxyacid dehydrogenase [Lentinula lateritia]KAJ4499534.1 D-isomer specific 2-hydroxyacid dehydrogenase [Lentinula lateritia]
MVVPYQSSAAGVLALLSEPDPVFKQHALKSLNDLVPRFWAEISEHIALIESLYDNDDMPKDARDLAALLASKVYYFLGEYVESLSFALGAGNAFEAESRVLGSEEYVETVMSMAIDKYIELCTEEQASSKQDKIDPRLQRIIENIFTRCISEGEYKQAVGIALESRRLDIISKIYEQVQDTSILSYAMEAVIDSGFSLSYRDTVLRFLFPLFPRPTAGDGSALAHALTRLLVTLGDPSLTVPLLVSLVPKEKLLAYQFSFDLVEGGARDYLDLVRTQLPAGDDDTKEIFDKIRSILTGQESVKLYLEFLKRNNHVDTLILKHTKDSLEPRSSIYHTALTLQNAFMHSGTTSDLFLRENLEWLGLASNWSKFSATAGLGVIHKGYYEQGMTILGPYLPQNGNESSVPGAAYSEGGALYALGLINTGCGTEVSGFLREALRSAQGEVVQHGAALGLGIAAMGSKNMETFEDLKNILFMDSAVAGEASGYAMGLIMLGTAAEEPVREMLSYARETQHEKIIRGLAIGIAFVFYGRQEEANQTVKELLAETDPILRYGGVYTLALAYAGTSNNDAVRQLLHIAVSDVSDDVRRAAVTSLAFLLFKNPSQVPRIVQLLSESYNPHVRCGATLALGIACAGTGMQDAIEILEPMTKDSVDFVRQGAFIALGMILLEQSEASSPSLASTRSLYSRIVADKHEDPMAKLGAALGQGLIDAGGRNVTINLQSRAGSRNTNAIVGMVLFCQFWYWYPLAHCACLAFEPTGIIGLDGDLKVPKFEFTSNAKPSLFAYPPATAPPKKETVIKVATAVLSTTAKVKAREKKKAAAEGDAMETDEKPDVKTEGDGDIEMKTEGSSKAGTSKSAKKEPSSETLPNLSRVTPAQLAYISFPADGKYQPVRAVTAKPVSTRGGKTTKQVEEKAAGGGGILILVDRRPQETAEFIQFETVIQPPPAEPVSTDDDDTTRSVESGPHIALDEDTSEAEAPSSFEVDVDVFTETLSDEDSLAKQLEPYEIICAMRERTKFLPSLLDRLPNLRYQKLIATTGRVNRGIDVNYAKEKGIHVSGTGSAGNATVEHIWALIMSVARQIVAEHINIRMGNPQWQTVVPMGLAGSTLGLIGVGRLGSATAKIAKVFGMKVIGWSPNLTPERAEAQGVEFIASKQELLGRSDIVSLHLVLSERTTKIINAADLDSMKMSAYLINTSRGPLIDEPALVDALKNKKIAGAGLDVFDQEPLPLDHPLRFLDNVTLSPHNGYVNQSNYEVFWTETVENIRSYLEGKPRSLLQ